MNPADGRGRPRCLWLTRLLPHPPSYGGDFLYSAKLIESLAEAGTDVTVLCHSNGGRTPSDSHRHVEWRVVPFTVRPPWRSLARSVPSITHRFDSPALRHELDELMMTRRWDAVVLDNISVGWALRPLSQKLARMRVAPRLIYVSHNHEASLRRSLAESCADSRIKRFALRVDAEKAGRLERDLVTAADLVTVNTPEDEARFRHDAPDQRYLVLVPGYDGPQLASRVITAEVPRRACVVGSFGWLGKQVNLDRFLAVAAPRFAANGAEIEVLGWMPEEYAAHLRARFPSVRVVTPVDDFGRHLRAARIGIIADEVGGGFKHKLLQYVFARVPVVTLPDGRAGAPLLPGISVLEFPDLDSLADGALAALDDLGLLNRVQEAALDACTGRFSWSDRGRELATEIRGSVAEAGDVPVPSRC